MHHIIAPQNDEDDEEENEEIGNKHARNQSKNAIIEFNNNMDDNDNDNDNSNTGSKIDGNQTSLKLEIPANEDESREPMLQLQEEEDDEEEEKEKSWSHFAPSSSPNAALLHQHNIDGFHFKNGPSMTSEVSDSSESVHYVDLTETMRISRQELKHKLQEFKESAEKPKVVTTSNKTPLEKQQKAEGNESKDNAARKAKAPPNVQANNGNNDMTDNTADKSQNHTTGKTYLFSLNEKYSIEDEGHLIHKDQTHQIGILSDEKKTF
ncbi:hypothetical protein RFI_17793, partial [Reticulomyxa filosa]